MYDQFVKRGDCGMKFSKQILVVLAVVAMLVSVFAFTSSAEFKADNIEDVLEYYQELVNGQIEDNGGLSDEEIDLIKKYLGIV